MSPLARKLRTALVLGRVSNLPTVWSNLLAGWLLAGGGDRPFVMAALLLGGSSLYVGGMFLNDFCDAGFDSEYRRERPIPAGLVSRRAVGLSAALWLVIGVFFLALLGWKTAGFAVLLLAVIILYDVFHKKIAWSPLLMAACRFLLYLVAASATAATIPPRVLLAAAALAGYVAGITYLARGESRPHGRSPWPLILLLLPLVNAFATFHPPDISLKILYALYGIFFWAWLLVPLWHGTNRSVGRVVAGLLAGIVLVDLLAVAPVLGFGAIGFLLLFGLALLLQRSIPAT
jgi:hypothetical protein